MMHSSSSTQSLLELESSVTGSCDSCTDSGTAGLTAHVLTCVGRLSDLLFFGLGHALEV